MISIVGVYVCVIVDVGGVTYVGHVVAGVGVGGTGVAAYGVLIVRIRWCVVLLGIPVLLLVLTVPLVLLVLILVVLVMSLRDLLFMLVLLLCVIWLSFMFTFCAGDVDIYVVDGVCGDGVIVGVGVCGIIVTRYL